MLLKHTHANPAPKIKPRRGKPYTSEDTHTFFKKLCDFLEAARSGLNFKLRCKVVAQLVQKLHADAPEGVDPDVVEYNYRWLEKEYLSEPWTGWWIGPMLSTV